MHNPVKIPLHSVKQFLEGVLQCPNQASAGDNANGVGQEVKAVGLAVCGKESLGHLGEGGKEESCDKEHREDETWAHPERFVVGKHKPACSGVCKEHKEMNQLVHWDTQKEFWEVRSCIRQIQQAQAQHRHYIEEEQSRYHNICYPFFHYLCK